MADDDEKKQQQQHHPYLLRKRMAIRSSEDKRKPKKRHHLPYLPPDLILEKILTRLPLETLSRFSSVCKLWNTSIHQDQNFASSHLIQSQNQKNPPLMFYILNLMDDRRKFPYVNHFLNLEDHIFIKDLLLFRGKSFINSVDKFELVGNCNGLICLSNSRRTRRRKGLIVIFNPIRDETLITIPQIMDGYNIVGYGFGFDSLTKEYKVVLILRSTTVTAIMEEEEFKCLVFTLGTNLLWRETKTMTTITTLLRTTTKFYKKAIFCGGALFWRTTRSDQLHMLLSFDLHDNKFQVIPLPAECASSNSTPQQQQQRVMVHLLVFKGSPCVARLEKTSTGGGGGDGGSDYGCCNVHLHILKDNIKKVWVKETIDVRIPCHCFFFEDIPTRILSFSDQILLYWFDGECLQFYDLSTKRFKVVKSTGYEDQLIGIFGKKNHNPDTDDDENMDYHLVNHIDNFFSLQPFIPKGAHALDNHAVTKLLKKEQGPPRGYLSVDQKYYILN